jgi:ADP-ribose pyrophosphatase YjhB (NUDIX family)
MAARFSEPGVVSLPAKHSIALVIRKDRKILAVRRPDDDDELPGVWGLPAGSFRVSETTQDLVRRIGHDKLGVELAAVRKLASGTQDRKLYRLVMDLWEVEMKETPTRSEWQWTDVETFRPGMERGSLCCALALNSVE